MTQFIARFKPEHFHPVPDGTILRYRGHHQNYDTKQYEVYMDVVGAPPVDWDQKGNQVFTIGDSINIPLIR